MAPCSVRIFTRIILLSIVLLGLLPVAHAQDTLKVMMYNLTQYGNLPSGCSTSVISVQVRDPFLNTILGHVKPDILGVCEMIPNEFTANRPLGILNGLGYAQFARPSIINRTSSNLVNTLYYRTDKLALKRHVGINSPVRTIDHFQLYYKSADLATNPDTAFINILVCHLKAGTTSSDSSSRRIMADAVVNYLRTNNARGNYIMTGDFNTYASTEPALTRLMARNEWAPVRFVDPLNLTGNWSSNPAIARWHSQCPTTSNNSGCFSGGGMDDRFDFFLYNRHLLNDSNGVTLVPNSINVVGNNGTTYNSSVTNSGNTAAPRTVLNALGSFSDHLPVTCQLRINRPVITNLSSKQTVLEASAAWHTNTSQLVIKAQQLQNQTARVSIYSTTGQLITEQEAQFTDGILALQQVLTPGVYYIHISPRMAGTSVKPVRVAVQ